MTSYKCLNSQIFSHNEYSIVPLRYEDRFKIMNWRNEQIDHLRQKTLLTIFDQNKYFDEIISHIFDIEKPNQILFSFLKDNECIGYGGLVHIDWDKKTAEISFIINTSLQNKLFKVSWVTFLKMIQEVAFNELNFQKIYTYAFDLRKNLYLILEECDFIFDSRIKKNYLFKGTYIDSVIYSKTNHEFKV
jgi:RimJ/RimL family protein N-acetyltransferase